MIVMICKRSIHHQLLLAQVYHAVNVHRKNCPKCPKCPWLFVVYRPSEFPVHLVRPLARYFKAFGNLRHRLAALAALTLFGF
ncbi:hypothetical protein CIG75_17030 [Tumebacillus algifaecis]|uniref:Transposase zinc-binding domain-containing protein n=1 Tax=Tumebacillus algifaecis TaxID=1214604 RepID=A0A223D4Y1_9BACL|nr:hypothetical protein CIG75_17030 [Tumebacillus algifaecis]